MIIKKINILPYFITFLTIIDGLQWSNLFKVSTFIEWAVSFIIIINLLWLKKKFFRPENQRDYFIVTIYFLWMIIGVIRGAFVAEGYWEWKQWVVGSLALSLPMFVYVFSNPEILQKVLNLWIKYALFFFIFFIFIIPKGAYHFYLGPLLLLACFLPVIKRKWQLIFCSLLLLMMFADFGARSQVIKATMAFLISFAYWASKYLTDKILKILVCLFWIAPIVLLYLGISGTFNLFEKLSSNEGKYVEHKIENGQVVNDDLSTDTRTFIYREVINSALNNHYVLCGRTPARGNDSEAFGIMEAEFLGTGKYERHSNEVCFPNVFTWLGLIGVILYCLIYLKSSYLAVYKSNNVFIKLLGVFIAFRFMYGWVEDILDFSILNISLWMMIAMGLSEKFRNMSNEEFKYWILKNF